MFNFEKKYENWFSNRRFISFLNRQFEKAQSDEQMEFISYHLNIATNADADILENMGSDYDEFMKQYGHLYGCYLQPIGNEFAWYEQRISDLINGWND